MQTLVFLGKAGVFQLGGVELRLQFLGAGLGRGETENLVHGKTEDFAEGNGIKKLRIELRAVAEAGHGGIGNAGRFDQRVDGEALETLCLTDGLGVGFKFGVQLLIYFSK